MTTHVSHGKPPGRCHDVVSSDVKALLRPKPTVKEGRSPLLYNEHCQTLAVPLIYLTEHTSQRVFLASDFREIYTIDAVLQDKLLENIMGFRVPC